MLGGFSKDGIELVTIHRRSCVHCSDWLAARIRPHLSDSLPEALTTLRRQHMSQTLIEESDENMKRDLRVFVVDDNPMCAHTLSAVLCHQGFHASAYTNPLKALHDACSSMLDVLISDVEMPDLGGVDLAIRILAVCPSCKIFLMSGHIGPISSLEDAREKGFHFPLFEKPLSALTLAEKINDLYSEY